MIRYSRACDFLDRDQLMTHKLCKRWYGPPRLTSPLQIFYCHHLILVDRYEKSISQMAMDLSLPYIYIYIYFFPLSATRLLQELPIYKYELHGMYLIRSKQELSTIWRAPEFTPVILLFIPFCSSFQFLSCFCFVSCVQCCLFLSIVHSWLVFSSIFLSVYLHVSLMISDNLLL